MTIIREIIICVAKSVAKKNESLKSWKYKWMGKQRARYLRLVLADCGTHLKVYGKPIIFQPHKIHIGNHCAINNGVQISPRGEVFIGDHVTMSRGSQITAGSLDLNHWSDSRYKEHVHTQGDVYIGDGTWLCVNSIVLPGVQITGKGVVVAAGAVVTHDISKDYVVVAGIPARIVKEL